MFRSAPGTIYFFQQVFYKQALGKCIIDGEAYGDSVVFVGYPEVLGQVGISTCLVLTCMYEFQIGRSELYVLVFAVLGAVKNKTGIQTNQ